jgi:hypothetical protein
MRGYVTVLMVVWAGAIVAGCGQRGNPRINDPGPPIELNKSGPGPMTSPDQAGATGLPQGIEKPKK